MMAGQVLAKLEAAGLTLRAVAGKLKVGPNEKLTKELASLIVEHRDGLFAIVDGPSEEAIEALGRFQPDFESGPVQCPDLVLVDLGGRLVAVDAAEHEETCRQLREYHAKLPGPPDLGCVDRHGKAKPRGKAKAGKRKAVPFAGDLFTEHQP
jgi:hypothetical protein